MVGTNDDKKRTRAPIVFLQEFQYGNDMFQTTTNISKKVHRNVDEVRELYSLHK